MPKPISDNPNVTAGRASKSVPNLSYPLGEDLPISTRLRFVEYDRYQPSDSSEERDTAYITLPIPVNVVENYSIRTTSEHEMGILGNISADNVNAIRNAATNGISVEGAEALKTGIAATTGNLRGGGFSATNALLGMLSSISSTDVKGTIQTFTGIVQNPHTTLLFEGVNLRPINLDWRFSPRSEEESEVLNRIFNQLKLRSHPEEISSGYALNYPDLCYVEFNGNIEKYMPKFQKAFINNINITPDSPGAMPLFKSGAPVTYTLQLQMIELSILTRNTLAEQLGEEI